MTLILLLLTFALHAHAGVDPLSGWRESSGGRALFPLLDREEALMTTSAPPLELRWCRAQRRASASPPPAPLFPLPLKRRASPTQALAILEQVDSLLVDEARRRLRRGDLRIVPLSPRARPDADAYCDCGSTRKIIHIDSSRGMSALAVSLYHELVHALDPCLGENLAQEQELERRFESAGNRYLAGAREARALTELVRLRRALRRAYTGRIFLSERAAYDAEYEVTQRLARLYPGHYRSVRRVSDAELLRWRGLSRADLP